jgi:CRISPR-associated exonuclease Cas4
MTVAFHELARAAYCPRQLYYARRADDEQLAVPPEVEAVRGLAFEYDRLLAASDPELAAEPLHAEPPTFRRNLQRARDRFPGAWPDLVDPRECRVLVEGKDARGYVQKVLRVDDDGGDGGDDGEDGDDSDDESGDDGAPVPSLVSPGDPPERGVWRPQSVRAVAAAKALSWREGRPVERAFVEYSAHGVVRRVELTTRRKAEYRTALRTARELDGPPPRVQNRAKCEDCEFRERCGVKTRSLKSLLGL